MSLGHGRDEAQLLTNRDEKTNIELLQHVALFPPRHRSLPRRLGNRRVNRPAFLFPDAVAIAYD
jgi:hypothetical protein